MQLQIEFKLFSGSIGCSREREEDGQTGPLTCSIHQALSGSDAGGILLFIIINSIYKVLLAGPNLARMRKPWLQS